MNKQYFLIFFLATSFFTFNSSAKTVNQYSQLKSYFEKVSELASGGSSLEFFGWEEKNETPNNRCKKLTELEVKSIFDEITNTVSMAISETEIDDELKPLYLNAKAEWIELTKGKNFMKCNDVANDHMSIGHITHLISSKYTFSYTFGWED